MLPSNLLNLQGNIGFEMLKIVNKQVRKQKLEDRCSKIL